MNLLKASNEAAFTAIYNRYWDKLFSIASHTLGSAQEAEEVVHDVFLKLWRLRTTDPSIDNLPAYLATAVKYTVLNRLRANGRRKQLLEGWPAADTADNPMETSLREKELMDELALTIQQLPARCQFVFRLSREQQYSAKEIARELGVSVSTVDAHLGKALRTLRLHFHKLLFLFFLFA
ncbi:MAG: RNA polymerase sigma-70 factor [Candidatus Pseudobacter hemicellulosilyticus]|uniref:RNA polymerase sigma-70 factor n=1 Tax=Candidatus Pseudobacter hemicellulosilyticus TaxID=3121375 RepID=A0AAJ5WYM2_9BACT|nr:MAG: RNA polymerase sigma-70 factor [Pseudobacter sp.]